MEDRGQGTHLPPRPLSHCTAVDFGKCPCFIVPHGCSSSSSLGLSLGVGNCILSLPIQVSIGAASSSPVLLALLISLLICHSVTVQQSLSLVCYLFLLEKTKQFLTVSTYLICTYLFNTHLQATTLPLLCSHSTYKKGQTSNNQLAEINSKNIIKDKPKYILTNVLRVVCTVVTPHPSF